MICLTFLSCQGKYRSWAKHANFQSKLPGDSKKRKAAAEAVIRTLDQDLTEKKISERIVPYSHKGFRRTAVEWLAATDQVGKYIHIYILSYHSSQPIQALEHPKFKELIDLASRAKNGVRIPGRKATRGEIKRLFKDHFTKLKAQLNVRLYLILALLSGLFSSLYRLQPLKAKLV